MNIRTLLKALLDKAPYVGALHRRNVDLCQELRALKESNGCWPPGHFYSPIPAPPEIEARFRRMQTAAGGTPGVDLNELHQSSLLDEFASYYRDQPFEEEKRLDRRYYFGQDYFGYGDAIFLYCFLRKTKPRRIVEVGSGFSSAAMLDTADSLDGWQPAVTFIEPDPARLLELLTDRDRREHEVIAVRLQDVSVEAFTSLESGDFVFIDSSHVLKCGSDVQMLFFDILPCLKEGVFVHFHDVFYPFEYHAQWLNQGIYWNEAYFLRAFLTSNTQWKIYWFNTYIAESHRSFLAEHMPLCLKNTGGSIYLRRTYEAGNKAMDGDEE